MDWIADGERWGRGMIMNDDGWEGVMKESIVLKMLSKLVRDK